MNRPALSILLASLACCAPPAHAVFKLTETVEKLFNEAETVLIATIIEVRTDAGTQLVLADVKDTPRGKPASDKLRLLVKKPDLHFKSLDKGHPLVIFAGKAAGTRGAVVVHAGDKWVMATTAGPQTWTPYKDNPALALAFPGRTSTLLRLLGEYKSGKSPFLNSVEDRLFTGGVKPLGKLPFAGVSQLLAADLDGDKTLELIAATPERLRVLRQKDNALAEASEFKFGGTRHCVTADVNADGKLDLLVDGYVLVSGTGRFTAVELPQAPSAATLITCALLDATGDHKPDAVLLTRSGELRIFENAGGQWKPSPPRSLWKADDPATSAVIGPFSEDASPAIIVARESGLTRHPPT
jgi:hypothetical protein